MSKRFDLLTVALTGQLSIILIVSAILALVASYLLLRLYRRAVSKSMLRRAHSDILETHGFIAAEPEHRAHDGALNFAFITRDSSYGNERSAKLFRDATRGIRLTAVIHIIAGLVFAATMTTAIFYAGNLEFLPARFLYFTWVNSWPVVIAIHLATGLSRRSGLIAAAIYFLIGLFVAAILIAKAPSLTFGQLIYLWLNPNLPPTLLLVMFFNRRMRAVGPLVLVFTLLAVAGASLAVILTGNNGRLMTALADATSAIGLGATSAMALLHLLGFAVFAVVGWMLLSTLRRLYIAKAISEQSLMIDAIWLVFAIVNSIGLVFEGRRWILSGLVAFALYKLTAIAGFRVAGSARRAQANGPRLLLLRVFALGKRSEALFGSLGKSWRTVGSMQMIAGPDLTTTAIEPHEFIDFVGGRLVRRFIDTGRTLDLRMSQMDLGADREGQYRVSEFFCHDDTWKMTLARLADESDAVLMDLRGFSPAHAGCVIEIHEIFNVVPLPRVVFAIDQRTDQTFLRQTMQHAWRQLKDRSPNHRLAEGQVALVELSGMSGKPIDNLLYALCAAATA
jgi:hypothetical protein